ncbi:hypothetical protein HED60_07610 [Planctomycetales bacterium ZRK34]|nr:hypothetical protein HED60_07610 [Planctomycetales bacterium ZRK34]
MNDRLEQLAERLCEQRLDAADLDALNDLLLDDEARRDYIRHVHLHAALKRQVRLQAEPASRMLRPSHSWRGRSIGWLTAAALIALAVTAWFVSSSFTTPTQPHDSQSTAVALLSDTRDAVFAEGQGAMQLGADLPPGLIDLRSGAAQMMFKSTAVVDLTGPCRLKLTGTNAAELIGGTLNAYVPEAARGFEIRCRGLRLIDHGTRFVVDAAPSGPVRILVTEGLVELRTRLAGGDEQSIWLTAMQARQYDPEAGRISELSPDAMVNTNNPVVNAGFEDAAEVATHATAWKLPHDVQRRSEQVRSGSYAICWTPSEDVQSLQIRQDNRMPITPAQWGRTISTSVWVQAEQLDPDTGIVVKTAFFDGLLGEGGKLIGSATSDRMVGDATGWRQISVQQAIPAGARNMNFQILIIPSHRSGEPITTSPVYFDDARIDMLPIAATQEHFQEQ